MFLNDTIGTPEDNDLTAINDSGIQNDVSSFENGDLQNISANMSITIDDQDDDLSSENELSEELDDEFLITRNKKCEKLCEEIIEADENEVFPEVKLRIR